MFIHSVNILQWKFIKYINKNMDLEQWLNQSQITTDQPFTYIDSAVVEVRGEPRHVLFQEPPELVNSYFEAKKDHFCILIKPVHADCVSSKRAFPFDGDRLNHLDQTFQRCQEIINFSPSSPCPQLLSYWSDFLDKPWSTPTRHAAWHTFDKIFTRITPDPLKGEYQEFILSSTSWGVEMMIDSVAATVSSVSPWVQSFYL